MRFSTMCEIISAVHLSAYVSSPYADRGGLMLVAPPGHLKTTAAELLSEFTGAVVLSDVVVKSLNGLRDDILGGSIKTLVFSDYAKLHKRKGDIASNIEGIIMSLAGEGYRKPSFADQRVQALPARCSIVACCTPKFSEEHEEEWLNNGFYRRFIWCRYRLDDPEYLEDAIKQWRKAEIGGNFEARIPTKRTIDYNLEPKEVEHIGYTLRAMIDRKISFILAQKIFCVLKWKFSRRNPNIPMKIWDDFSESLTKDGALLQLHSKEFAA